MSHPPKSSRWFLYTVVALVFAGGVWYFGFRAQPAPTQTGMSFRSRSKSNQPVPVRALPAQKKDLVVSLRAIGTVTPLNTVTVRSRIEGELLRVAFTEGQLVKAGELLAEVDPEPYRIRLAQADARLRQNEASLRTAEADLTRTKQLHAQSLLSQQQLEAQQALVAEREAIVSADRASVEDAKRQLAYTKIEAPIAGRVGLRHVDVGNVVRASDAAGLVTITQVQPVSVMFTVPEVDLQKVVEPIRAGEALEVEAWDRGEQTLLSKGFLRTIDNQIDLATGTLKLKAEFPNPDEKLFPNQFVNVRLRVRTLKDAVVVSTAAIQFGSRGTYVFISNAKTEAEVRDVVLGPADGPWQSITKGLAAGDLVVTEGVDRLREGRPLQLIGDSGFGPPTPGGPGGGKGGKGGKGEGKKGEGKKSDGAPGEGGKKGEKGEKTEKKEK